MPTSRLIFGCGYVGCRVAARWRAAGDQVYAFTRSDARAAEFRQAGYEPVVGDVTQTDSLRHLPPVDTVLFAIGYDRSAQPTIHQVYAEGFRHVLSALGEEVRRVIYISSTGVYGGAQGGWVDESTSPNPQREGGKASLAAEHALAESPWAARGVCLRLAGIYGPNRLPYLNQLREGKPIEAPQQGWLNLIHVDDAAAVVMAAADAPSPPPVVCVADGTPVQRIEYYRMAARLLGAPEPTFSQPPPDSPRAARAVADKRVSNQLMVESLGVRPVYPSYCEGLRAILGEE